MYTMSSSTIQRTENKIQSLNDRINEIDIKLTHQKMLNDSFTDIMTGLNNDVRNTQHKIDQIYNLLSMHDGYIEYFKDSISELSNTSSEFNKMVYKNERRRNWMRGRKRKR
nr:MAG TPA: SlyX-like protein [Caudoviricetes sp.]